MKSFDQELLSADINLIYKISNLKEFQKFKKIQPKTIKEIYNLRDYVHLKLSALGI